MRYCDGLKRSETNAAAGPRARVDLPSALSLAEVASRMRAKHKGESLAFWKADHADA